MSPPPYMRLYWGDYHRDTRHLSRSEHGAYLMLLSALWNSGGKIAADDVNLAKLAMCTPPEWADIKTTIMAFFRVSRGKLTHRRLTSELAKYESTIGKRKEAGKTGSLVSNGKRKRSSAANAGHLPTQPEPEPESRLETPNRVSKSTRRVTADERTGGSSSSRSEVLDFEELRERIQREAAEIAAKREVG